MARFIDSLSVLPEPRPGVELWRTLSEVLRSHGATFVPGTPVILNDNEEQDTDPLDAMSELDAVRRIVQWPALGGVRYAFVGQQASVFTFGELPGLADVITVSTVATAYLVEAEFRSRFDALIAQLHHAAEATRTMCDFELLSPGSFWFDELKRVRQGRFEGRYAIDLR